MKLNEVLAHVDLSKRAIKYYEEQGLLKIKRDVNGYRDYTEEDILILKEISAYRKLDISISDIKVLLSSNDITKLETILEKKEMEWKKEEHIINALKVFIQTKQVDVLYDSLDYETIAEAIKEAVPGFYGYYFLHHFFPFLQIKIETKQQEEAYHRILRFWDETDIRLPFIMKITGLIMYHMFLKPSLEKMIEQMETAKDSLINQDEESYEICKKKVVANTKLKRRFLYRYSVFGYTQRKFMRELQNKGYNDIYIPAMKELSSEYKEYRDALEHRNAMICKELGLYYDHKFNLRQKS